MLHTSSIPASFPASSALAAQGKRVGVLAETSVQRETCREALRAAELRRWTVELQHDDDPDEMLPLLDGPVILDTRGYAPRKLLALLVALTHTKISVLALVDRSDLLARRLVTACPQISAVVRALPTPDQLAAWTMAVALSDQRRADQAVAHLGIAAPSEAVIDVRQLVILQACHTAATLNVAETMSGVPLKTLNRCWLRLRATLDLLEAGHRDRPDVAAAKVMAALAARPTTVAEAAVEVAQDAVVAEQEVQVVVVAAGAGSAAPTEERPSAIQKTNEQQVEIVPLDGVDWSRLWPSLPGRVPRSSPPMPGRATIWPRAEHPSVPLLRAAPSDCGNGVPPTGRCDGELPRSFAWDRSWHPAALPQSRRSHAGP